MYRKAKRQSAMRAQFQKSNTVELVVHHTNKHTEKSKEQMVFQMVQQVYNQPNWTATIIV